jgi:hypothetical protein
MSPVRRTRLVSFVVFLVLTAFLAPVHAARLALVIGNDAYVHVPKLRNARADARAMAHALEDAGFKVSLALDQDRAGMNESLRRFRNNLSGGDEAVFFYAGHGVQLGGTNYLLPVDMKGNDVDNVVDDAIRLQRVLDDLAERKTRFALAIVDACRDNPFVGSGRNLETRGLVPVQAANGQMVIYSAGAGQKALDRLNDQDTSPNGLFTRVFVKELGKPGVPIHDAVRNVRQEVVRLANGVGHEQVPAIYDQSIGDFYFRRGAAAGGGAGGGGGAATPAPKPAVSEAAAEKEYWEDAKRLNNVAAYRGYLDRYPSGRYAALAKASLEKLAAEEGDDAYSGDNAPPPVAPQAPTAPVQLYCCDNFGRKWCQMPAGFGVEGAYCFCYGIPGSGYQCR